MKNILILLHCILTTVILAQEDKYVMVIHGGAGYITQDSWSTEKENAYRKTITQALLAGYEQLNQGKNSVDAVQEAIIIMENSPLFNAGKGAVFTHEKTNELDASIMYGPTSNAGAVAGVRTIKNPIIAARAVMEKSPHVLLSREGAESFAQEQGLELVPATYFHTQENYDRLINILKAEQSKTDRERTYPDEKFGTVGAVALDHKGNIAAGTSTGGMTNKRWARIGDSPIIGAGTYANESVGISSTGWGEFYIRTVAAYDVAAQMKYGKIPLALAMQNTLHRIAELGGNGGMIGLDKDGRISMRFNTPGMIRGAITENGKVFVKFYGEE